MELTPLSWIMSLVALIPHPYRDIAESLVSLIVVASLVVAKLPVSSTRWVRAARFVSSLVHPDEAGTIKIPFSNYVIGIGVRPRPMTGAPLPATATIEVTKIQPPAV